MSKQAIWHEGDFRSTDDFVVAHPFRVSGKNQHRGDFFDKSLVDDRTLRCLYDNRDIVPAQLYVPEKPHRSSPSTEHELRGRPIFSIPVTELAAVLTSGVEAVANMQFDEPLVVRHIGHGKFCVMQGEARIGDPKSREEAEADLAILAA